MRSGQKISIKLSDYTSLRDFEKTFNLSEVRDAIKEQLQSPDTSIHSDVVQCDGILEKCAIKIGLWPITK